MVSVGLGGAAGLVYISFHGTYFIERERERKREREREREGKIREKLRGGESRAVRKTVLMG